MKFETPPRFWHRMKALIRKECWQLLRDRSNFALGILLPIILILLFGYGLSLDVNNAPVAVVLEDRSTTVMEMVAPLQLSPYLTPILVSSMPEAEQLMDQHQVEAIVRFPQDYSRQYYARQGKIQLILQGVDANRARIIEAYIQSAFQQHLMKRETEADKQPAAGNVGRVVLVERRWFNADNTSTWFLVPGLIVIIMTLVGALLTSMIMAREWERGTLEALFVTPVRPAEILIAKVIPYFCVGMLGFLLCLAAARYLFHLPIYGSVVLLIGVSVLYLLVALGIGLLISSATKNQFLACQLAILTGFMPAVMLSGFMFDLRNVPDVIRWIGHVFPATYYLELLKTLFLAGNVWPLIIKNSLILLGYIVVLFALTLKVTKKQLD